MKTHGELRYGELPTHRDRTAGEGVWGVKAAPYVTIKVKRLFPRCDPYRDGWVTFADTAEVARDLEWLLSRYPLEMNAETAARLATRADEHRATEQAVHEILTGARPHLPLLEPARPARDYQLTAADLAIETGRLLLTDELGLGKSMSGLLVLRAPDALPALIVCPTHLPAQWEDELAKTLPWLRVHQVRKGIPYDVAAHRSMKGHEPDVLIMGYAKLRGWDDTLAGQIRTVIFDEAQELRKPGSQKWSAAARVADQATYRVGLTATPVYNYAGEIHSVYEVIAPGVLGTRDEFVREWSGVKVGMHDNVSVKDPAALGIYLRSEGLMLRRSRKDVGRELPDVIRVTHGVESAEDVLNDLMEEDGTNDLAAQIVERSIGNQELFRARGEFDWRVRRATGIAKAPYVAGFVNLLLETDEQVVLFGWHRTVYDVWRHHLAPHHPAFYTGSESPTQKNRARDAFLDGEARVLVMSLRSGAGLDGLQEVAHIGVFGELDWSPGMHEQCIGRLQRDGQDEPVLAYFLVSDFGADPLMAEVLQLKRMQSEPLQDPDAPLFAPQADHADRITTLAEYVLAKRKKART